MGKDVDTAYGILDTKNSPVGRNTSNPNLSVEKSLKEEGSARPSKRYKPMKKRWNVENFKYETAFTSHNYQIV